MLNSTSFSSSAISLPKSPSGIPGLDEVTGGGLPRGRTTLVCGGPGCGKTLFATQFLVSGAVHQNEPGVFMTFEETEDELVQNAASLGFDLADLAARKLLYLDFVRVERSEIEETGEYSLDGLFIRLESAVAATGAKRIVLDTIEALYAGLTNTGILRAELRRLFRWLKDKGLTAVVTAERGESSLTRHGLEEYVSDCVILLDHRVVEQVSTRRLRVVKYRGTAHGTNEYPFFIDHTGISVLPITSLGLNHAVTTERISTGIPDLDQRLGGKGYYRGSTILVSGTAGTGKTSLAATFALATSRRGEHCLYLAFEESPAQIMRNMASIGVDLEPALRSGLLHLQANRPTYYGLETHLAVIHQAITRFSPSVVILDPISNLSFGSAAVEGKSMLMRLVDHLKANAITALFTSLTSEEPRDGLINEIGISSLIDTWLVLSVNSRQGQHERALTIRKSRGMPHSDRSAVLMLTDHGIELKNVEAVSV